MNAEKYNKDVSKFKRQTRTKLDHVLQTWRMHGSMPAAYTTPKGQGLTYNMMEMLISHRILFSTLLKGYGVCLVFLFRMDVSD